MGESNWGGGDANQGDWEDPRDVCFAGSENESPSDLDWGDVEKYGADSEMGQFLQNDEETQGYEGFRRQTDMVVYRISAEDQILRDRRGEITRTFKQFAKTHGGL